MSRNLVLSSILARFAQIWGPWVLPLLDVRHCSKLSLCAIARKKYDPNWALIWAIYFLFFSKIWIGQSLYIMVRYHHIKYQNKVMIQSREHLVMNEWID